MLIGTVRPEVRERVDGTRVYYLRYRSDDTGTIREVRERLFASGPSPDRAELREWQAMARKALHERAMALAAPLAPGETRPLDRIAVRTVKSLPDALELAARTWRGEFGDPGISPATAKHRETVAEKFISYLGEHWPAIRTMDKLTQEHVAAWRAWRAGNVMQSTLATELIFLQSWFDRAARERWTWIHLQANPKGDGRVKMPAKSRPDIAANEQVHAVIARQGDPMRRAAVALLAATGLRQGELRGLTIEDYDPTERVLVVPPGDRESTKHHGRTLPLGPVAAAALDAWLAVRPVDGVGLLCRPDGRPQDTPINQWFNESGLTPHDLRRWFCTTLERAECPDYIIAYLMAHTVGKVRRRYSGEHLASVTRPWMERVDEAIRPYSNLVRSGENNSEMAPGTNSPVLGQLV
jgi:integrase